MARTRTLSVSPVVAEFSKELKRQQTQKFRMSGGVEARMLLALAAYNGEHLAQQARDTILSRPVVKDEDRNKLSLVFNLIKRAAQRRMGRMWAARYEYKATPNIDEPHAYDKADVVIKASKGLDRKLRERRQHWKRIWWMTLGGVAVEHTPWIEEATTESMPELDENGELLWIEAQSNTVMPQSAVIRLIQQYQLPPERFRLKQTVKTEGEVGSEVFSGFNIFIESAVPTIAELGPDQSVTILQTKTVAWVQSVFGNDVDWIKSDYGQGLSIVRTKFSEKGPAISGLNMQDLMPAIQGVRGPDDPPLCLVATRYQPGHAEFPNGRRTIFIPNQGEPLDDGDTAYGEIPLVDFHNDAPTTGFYTGDAITDMVPSNKFFNKRMSQLGEMANSSVYETLLLGPDLAKEDLPADMAGTVMGGLSAEGIPQVVAMQHASPPSFFLESIKLILEVLQQIGATDITGYTQFPGQLRGPLAIPILTELIDSEFAPLFEHVGEQMAFVKQMRLNRIKQFYPPVRTLKFTGKGKQDKVLIFHTDDVMRSGIDYEITIDQSTVMPELSALRESRIVERMSGPLAGLYVDPRTGRIDFSRVAKDLKYGDEEREDRAAQYRTLAVHLIGRLWNAETLPEDIPLPMWDHAAILDELDASMATVPYLESSPQVRQNFVDFYERCRAFLAAIQEAQQQAMQTAVAMATQQAAAKSAAVATDAAIGQVEAQARAAQKPQPEVVPAGQALVAARRESERASRTDRPNAGREPAGSTH